MIVFQKIAEHRIRDAMEVYKECVRAPFRPRWLSITSRSESAGEVMPMSGAGLRYLRCPEPATVPIFEVRAGVA